jgi:agmatinase
MHQRPPRRTRLPDARTTPRFAGIATFCRVPRIEDVAPDVSPVDWAIYGVPFDSGVTFRPGARFGPRAVRDASQYVKPYHVAHAVDVAEVLGIADAGDAPVNPYSISQTLDNVAAFAAGLGHPQTTRLLAVGGDHSIAYANIKATWQRAGSPKGGLALIHFDSHLDTVDAVWGERFGHASPFIRAIEDGLIDPRAMISIGIKGPLNSPDDLNFARDRGVTIIQRDALGTPSGQGAIADFVAALGARPAYLTFDIDVVDPAFAPGTGTPSIGGVSSSEALALLRSLRGVNIVGADVVEVLPDRDVSQITALLAAHIILEILALDAVRRTG